jgi:hypothetical protein
MVSGEDPDLAIYLIADSDPDPSCPSNIHTRNKILTYLHSLLKSFHLFLSRGLKSLSLSLSRKFVIYKT